MATTPTNSVGIRGPVGSPAAAPDKYKVGSEQLFDLMRRGLSETEAATMIVNGRIEPIVRELLIEYAVEMNRLIQL